MDDLVGASEAADLLGVEVQRISRYRNSGRMPEPVAQLAATDVWRAKDVKAMKKLRVPKDVPELPLLGTSEAAGFLGVNKSQVGRWVRTGVFPAPVVRLAAGPVWTADQIEAFAETRV